MQSNRRRGRGEDTDIEGPRSSEKITGKELTSLEEVSARLTTLIEMLDERGIINKKEYYRNSVMRL
nr:hypothetical protein [Thermoproteota archaeon]